MVTLTSTLCRLVHWCSLHLFCIYFGVPEFTSLQKYAYMYGWKRDGSGELCVCVCVCRWGSPGTRRAIKPVCSPVGEERTKAKCQRQMDSVIATCAAGPTTKTPRERVCACVDCVRLRSLCVVTCAYMFLKMQPTHWNAQKNTSSVLYILPGLFLKYSRANFFIEIKFCVWLILIYNPLILTIKNPLSYLNYPSCMYCAHV